MSGWLYKDGLAVPAPRPEEGMTVFDVLRKLVSGDPWNEEERRQAFALIGELERQGVLGNRAAEIHTPTKEEKD